MEITHIISTIDTHTAGEPTRIVLNGLPPIKGETMVERKQFIKNNLDFYRTALIYEPRGHKDMFGAILVPPISKEADFGIIFMDHGGYLDMCGHGTIGVATAVFQLGMVEKISSETPVLFDTPSGLIKTIVMANDGKIQSVFLFNVPSFMYEAGVKINIPNLGQIKIDIAFGGNFFALVSSKELNMTISKEKLPDFIKLGMIIKDMANQKIKIQHPILKHLKSIELVEFYEEEDSINSITSKNIVVFGDGQFDRSPCGTGTSATMAMLHSKGKLSKEESFINYGILGTSFRGEIYKEVKVENYRGIIPKINGNAFITGMNKFLVDIDDPLKYGFSL